MAATISASYFGQIQTTWTPANGGSGNPSVLFNFLDASGTLTASTSVPATKTVSITKALSAGSATLDLTAIVDDDLGTIDLSGLKVQLLTIKNPSSNANKITITKGASNGYGLDSAGTSWTVVLDPGQQVGPFILADAAPDVGGSTKTWDLSGTGSQSLKIQLVAG